MKAGKEDKHEYSNYLRFLFSTLLFEYYISECRNK